MRFNATLVSVLYYEPVILDCGGLAVQAVLIEMSIFSFEWEI